MIDKFIITNSQMYKDIIFDPRSPINIKKNPRNRRTDITNVVFIHYSRTITDTISSYEYFISGSLLLKNTSHTSPIHTILELSPEIILTASNYQIIIFISNFRYPLYTIKYDQSLIKIHILTQTSFLLHFKSQIQIYNLDKLINTLNIYASHVDILKRKDLAYIILISQNKILILNTDLSILSESKIHYNILDLFITEKNTFVTYASTGIIEIWNYSEQIQKLNSKIYTLNNINLIFGKDSRHGLIFGGYSMSKGYLVIITSDSLYEYYLDKNIKILDIIPISKDKIIYYSYIDTIYYLTIFDIITKNKTVLCSKIKQELIYTVIQNNIAINSSQIFDLNGEILTGLISSNRMLTIFDPLNYDRYQFDTYSDSDICSITSFSSRSLFCAFNDGSLNVFK